MKAFLEIYDRNVWCWHEYFMWFLGIQVLYDLLVEENLLPLDSTTETFIEIEGKKFFQLVCLLGCFNVKTNWHEFRWLLLDKIFLFVRWSYCFLQRSICFLLLFFNQILRAKAHGHGLSTCPTMYWLRIFAAYIQI